MAVDNSEQVALLEQQVDNLRVALTQVLYQNEMLLGWVKGGVITVDNNGVILSANAIASNSLGCTEEELLGLQFHETFHHTLEDGSEYPWEFSPVFAAVEDGSSHHVTGGIFWKQDGSSVAVDYIVSSIRDENNTISGATLIFRNLTEQRLQDAKKIHGMKLESIGELSAGIAHEINTPIQFIGSNMSFLQDSFQDLMDVIEKYSMLKEKMQDNAEFGKELEEIAEEEENADVEYLQEEIPRAIDQTSQGVESVSKLVLGLKGFAHSVDNSEKQTADINEIINNSLIVCRNTYKYVANLEKELGDLPEVKVHHGDLGQVILNLVVNGAQAIEDSKGGSEDMGLITIRSYVEDNSIVVSITDTGGGIDESVAKRIFDPFFTTKEVGRGSGQGLAIARNIVHDKHGGELNFESELGVGTTFFISIPIS